jgi:hypothetical protein
MTDVKKLADRPAIDASEIEVTPEMIEAARTELDRGYWGDGRYDLGDDRISAIFSAMIAARLLSFPNR